MNSISQLDHEGEFQGAWDDPSNTRFEMPPVDVNRVLAEHYRTNEPLTFTRTMLWDMEVRKAGGPTAISPLLYGRGVPTLGAGVRWPTESNPSYGHRSSACGLSPRSMGWSWNRSASTTRSRRLLSSEPGSFLIVTGTVFVPACNSLCFTSSTRLAATNRDH